MRQVLIIHGGTSFDSYENYLHDLKTSPINYDRLKKKLRWNSWLADELPAADVLLPSFPNSDNAVYDEWKIYFEKIIPLLTGDVSLVGHSLGAMFLAKYLHESPLPRKVRQLVLIAPAYDDDSLEDLGSFAIESASGLDASTETIHLFHSKDDPVVPFGELAKFRTDLPNARAHVFADRGHFLDPEFPELLEILQTKNKMEGQSPS